MKTPSQQIYDYLSCEKTFWKPPKHLFEDTWVIPAMLFNIVVLQQCPRASRDTVINAVAGRIRIRFDEKRLKFSSNKYLAIENKNATLQRCLFSKLGFIFCCCVCSSWLTADSCYFPIICTSVWFSWYIIDGVSYFEKWIDPRYYHRAVLMIMEEMSWKISSYWDYQQAYQ